MNSIGGGLYLVVVIACIALAVLWILLPFAVFGLKDLVREVLREQRRTNTLLEQAERRRAGPDPVGRNGNQRA